MLIRSKKESAILDNRATHGPADLVFDTPWRRRSRLLVQIASCIQRVVIVKPERGSVKVIGSALGDDIHHRSGRASKLRRKLVCDEADLLDNIRIVDRLLPPRKAGIVAVLAVDHEVVRAHAHPID